MSEQIKHPQNNQNPNLIENELTARVVPVTGRLTLDSVSDKSIVLPRKELIRNQLFISRGGAKLLQPDQEAIRQAVVSCDKLEYFAVAETSKFKESEAKMLREVEFSDLVVEPLLEKVRDRFPDSPLLTFRGGMASINGTQEFDYGHSTTIPDITEIVKNGGDRDGVFNAATTSMQEPLERMALNLHRVVQYACGTGFRKFDIGSEAPEVAETLFPVISVYDTSMLQKAGGNVWAVEAKEGFTSADALLKTYILDCPDY